MKTRSCSKNILAPFVLVIILLLVTSAIPYSAVVPIASANTRVLYTGSFQNQTATVGGPATLDIEIGINTVSGYMNFSNGPDTGALCGAGSFTGTRSGNMIQFSFSSDDSDPGCGFERGWVFYITATLSADQQTISGNYSVQGQGGTFSVSRAVLYTGNFTNSSTSTGGLVTINLYTGVNTVSGYMNFTNTPGTGALCGAGPFAGTRNGNTLQFSFVSNDPDQGCGFDDGLAFDISGTLSGDQISGTYYVRNNGQSGTFSALVMGIPSQPSYELEFYTDANYNSKLCHYSESGKYEVASICNDQISSVKIKPGWSLRIFRDDLLYGPSTCLSTSDSDLSNNRYDTGEAINDSITSFILYDKVVCMNNSRPITSLNCSTFNATIVSDGICQQVKDNIYIAIVDISNPNIRVELAHQLGDFNKGTFRQKSVRDFVSENSGAANNGTINHYFVAVNGTEFRDNPSGSCVGLSCTSPTARSILGIGGTTFGERGSGRLDAGKWLINKYNDNFSSFFMYKTGFGDVYRSLNDNSPWDIPSDENIARELIQGRINESDFVVGYRSSILDGEYLRTNGDNSDSRAKTAVGVSADHKRIFLAVSKAGVSTEDLANHLKNMGAYRVILLDGNSSSQYLSKAEWHEDGEHYSAAFGGFDRKVINAIVIYNATSNASRIVNIPLSGGIFALASTVQVSFDANSFTQAVNVTYTPMMPTNTNGFGDVDRFYDITVTTANNVTLQLQKPYTVTITYDEDHISPHIREQDLGIYFWDGAKWRREPTSTINTDTNTVTAVANHFSQWGVLAPFHSQIYLPVIQKDAQ